MNNRFANIIIAMVATAMLHEAVAKEAPNRPYVQSGPDGVFYARCIPAAATGGSGFTEIYKVQKDRDERVDRYDWYTKHGVVLGWSPIAGKVAVLAIRPQPLDSLDKPMFQVLGCEQIPGSNDYVFTIQIAKEKKLSFDILTGDLYAK